MRQHVDFLERRRAREPFTVERSTAIATAAASMHAPHNPVRSLPRTQGSSHEACSTVRPVANASPSSMAGSHTASTARRGRPEHEFAPRPRPCDATTRLRLPQRSHGPAASRQRACRAAAVRQAAAATIRPPTSRILWSYGEIRQSGSAEGGRWVLRRTGAHLSSTHEPWCPRHEVRSRPGRPLRRRAVSRPLSTVLPTIAPAVKGCDRK